MNFLSLDHMKSPRYISGSAAKLHVVPSFGDQVEERTSQRKLEGIVQRSREKIRRTW